MAITYHAGRRIQGLSTDEAPTPNLTYDDFPTSYSGWTKSSNDATKLVFSSNRANFSIGETYVDARAYGYDIGFDLDGDYCIDFDFTFTNTPFTSAGQAVAFTFGISTTTADVGGEDPTMNSEQTKIAGYPSGSYTYIYVRAKSSAGTNASGNDTNTAFPLNSSATQLRYGRLSRSGTTFKVQFFSESTRETEVANYSVTTTAQTVRYLYLKSYSQNSGQAWAGYLDNIKIYKDQSFPTPVKPTNVQVGSRYEETDTRKMYSRYAEYKVHTFLNSTDDFEITAGSGDVEYLVVAGGGGGYCAGGGAGGYRTGTSALSTSTGTSGVHTVTVGAGGYSGQCNVNGYGNAGMGEDSVFNTITSDGGGFAGGTDNNYNVDGGSGAGAGGGGSVIKTGGTATSGQGQDGGDSEGGGSTRSGGGGGAGQEGNTSAFMNGGNGLQSSINGTATYYAGGGNGGGGINNSATGGDGGLGGGGTDGTVGTANTGGGGGGHDSSARAGYGGSGIVIVRYNTQSGIIATGGTITTIGGWKEKGTT